MSAKAKIVLEAHPRGVRHEGILNGTPKPGTCMQIDAAVEPVNGALQWEVYQPGTDGHRRLVAVLEEDSNQGRSTTTAYVSGDRAMIYCPMAGDRLNMLVANIAGTGDTFAIGDLFIIDTGTGKLIATTGSPEAEPFQCIETEGTALTADTLVECFYTGY